MTTPDNAGQRRLHESHPVNTPFPPPAGRQQRQAAVLRYDKGADSAPRVVAKGYGAIADTIVRTARDHGVYVHPSRELVDLLMRVDLDAHIPPALYVAVAELLAWLHQVEHDSDER